MASTETLREYGSSDVQKYGSTDIQQNDTPGIQHINDKYRFQFLVAFSGKCSLHSTAIKKNYFLSWVATLSIMASGITIGWSSPSIPKLMDASSPITVTSSDGSWILVAKEIGCIIATVPVGWIMDRYVQKIN